MTVLTTGEARHGEELELRVLNVDRKCEDDLKPNDKIVPKLKISYSTCSLYSGLVVRVTDDRDWCSTHIACTSYQEEEDV